MQGAVRATVTIPAQAHAKLTTVTDPKTDDESRILQTRHRPEQRWPRWHPRGRLYGRTDGRPVDPGHPRPRRTLRAPGVHWGSPGTGDGSPASRNARCLEEQRTRPSETRPTSPCPKAADSRTAAAAPAPCGTTPTHRRPDKSARWLQYWSGTAVTAPIAALAAAAAASSPRCSRTQLITSSPVWAMLTQASRVGDQPSSG
jgi:hypothetical protein